MRGSFLRFIPAMLLVTGCFSPERKGAVRPPEPVAAPLPYVRIINTDSNHIQLQIAAREFLPQRSRGPAVWLTGVSHIGETNYYAALQAHLNAQSLVLYEGVGAAEAEAAAQPAAADTTPSQGSTPTEESDERGSLQSAMAASLGLVFQLNAIDYRRDNFRNSDLSITQLRELMNRTEAVSGNTGASESFENLLQTMQGNSWLDAILQFALRLLGANPKFQGLGRLALIDLIGEIQGDPSRLQGLPPDMKQLLEVLLQRRNEKVVADLTTQLPKMGRRGSIAVFFGTGHMPDLETKLRTELHYRPSRQLWFTAFEVDLEAARITPSERGFIENLIQWQLREAGALVHETK
jgi:hypothetical protein